MAGGRRRLFFFFFLKYEFPTGRRAYCDVNDAHTINSICAAVECFQRIRHTRRTDVVRYSYPGEEEVNAGVLFLSSD